MHPKTLTAFTAATAFTVCGTAGTASAQPQFSPVRWLPGDAAVVRAAGPQRTPAIARGGDQFLVVWADESSAISHLAWEQSAVDIVGMRLDASGAPIDPTPFTISRAVGRQTNPRVVWNGSAWVVGWEHQTPTAGYYQTETSAAIVSPAGVVGPRIEVFPGELADEFHMAVNSGGETMFVKQGYSGGAAGLWSRRMRADGTFAGGWTNLVPETFFLFFNVDLDSAGGEYLLTWDDSAGPVARRYDAQGAPIGPAFALPEGRRAIFSGPAGYYVVWWGGQFGNTLLGSPMSVQGALAVPQGVALAGGGSGITGAIDGAWSDAGEWWLSFDHVVDGLVWQRVSASGALLDASPVGFSPAGRRVEVQRLAARPGGGMAAVWADEGTPTEFTQDIVGLTATAPSAPGAARTLSLAQGSQTDAEVVAGPGHYLVVYASRASGAVRVLGQRVTAAGTALDAEPVEFAVTPEGGGHPSAAWNGQVWLIVWSAGDGRVLARRADNDLNPIDPAPIDVLQGATADVAALGNDFLVVTTNYLTYPQWRSAFARRVSGAGAVLDPAPMNIGGFFANHARVEAFAGSWIVVFQNNFSHNDPQSAALFVRVAPDGSFGGAFNISSSAATAGHPDLAASGDTALFVWRSNSLANADNDVQARRMRDDGSFLDATFTVSAAPGRQLFPVAAWTGREFLMAWDDKRDAEAFFDQRDNVYASRIAAAGAPILDPAGIGLFTNANPEILPAVAGLGAGRVLVAASVFRDETGVQSYRLGLRVAGPVCPGDANGDLVVDFADLNLVLSNFGSVGQGVPGDTNGDGVVDFADLNDALSGFGGAC